MRARRRASKLAREETNMNKVLFLACASITGIAIFSGCGDGTNEAADEACAAGSAGCSNEKVAMAVIESTSGSAVKGSAVFTQNGDTVTLVVNIEDATPGEHAVHIHEMP